MISRRDFITAVGGTAASVWIFAEASDLLAAGKHAARAGGRPAFEYLSADDAADLEAATAQIIPSDATPGAREARVVYFIDKSLATFNKDQRPVFQKGVKELRSRAAKQNRGVKSFAALTEAQQIAVIASLERDKHDFFPALRGATIAGMLANPEHGGNFNKAGWKMLGFDDRFSWSAPFGWYDRDV